MKCVLMQALPGNCIIQEDATEHIAAVLDRIKPEYLVSMHLSSCIGMHAA